MADDNVEPQQVHVDQETARNSLRSICEISISRAIELLEAASGSVERAVEIHFAALTGVANVTTPKQDSENEAESAEKEPFSFQSSRYVTSKPTGPPSLEKGSPAKRSRPRMESFFSPRLKKKAIPQGDNQDKVSSHVVEDQAQSDYCHGPKSHPQLMSAENCALQPLDSDILNTKASTMTSSAASLKSDFIADEAPLSYAMLAQMFAELTATTKRIAKLEALRCTFWKVITALGGIDSTRPRHEDARVLTCALDLILGKLSLPEKEGNSRNAVTLQVSGAAVSTAVQTVTGVSRNLLRQSYRDLGDLGDVAAKYFLSRSSAQQFFVAQTESSKSPSSPELSLVRVHELLYEIATVSPGTGSQKNRQQLLVKLLRASKDKVELCFLVRTLLGNMRLGATIKTVLQGLSTAVREFELDNSAKASFLLDRKEQARIGDMVQETYHICPRLDEIARALLEGGVEYAQKTCSLSIGFPVQPMLANPAHSLEQVRKFMSDEKNKTDLCALAEWKYDGVRCQAHWDGSTVRLFSRHLLDNSEQFPDVAEYLLQARSDSVHSFILDSEIVGVYMDATKGKFRMLPFQDLSTRRGSQSVERDRVQVRIYAFDLLYLNGESLLKVPFWKRRKLLQEVFKETLGFAHAQSVGLATFDDELLRATLEQAVTDGAEGLMIKLTGEGYHAPNADVSCRTFGYESGTRSQLWLKLKRDYVVGYADTIDVVPIGAWYGNGRKAQKGFLSPILFAVYDEDEGAFRSISRCMSFTDAMYQAIKNFYFHGKPYPEKVGSGDPKVDAATVVQESNASHVVASDDESLEDMEDQTAEVADGLLEGRVNCYTTTPPSTYIITNETPSIWFKPMEVFEVSFADLSLSQAHTAGAGLLDDPQGRGVAMRFPRFKRRRPDKSVEQATTTVQIAQLFGQQSKMKR